MNANYPSAAQLVRNISDIKGTFQIVEESGRFRIVQFDPPFFDGSEFWIVNERGFLWEPAEGLATAQAYLLSDEAVEYNQV